MGIHRKKLELSLSNFEPDPSGDIWVRLAVGALAGDFAGTSHCVLRRRELDATVGELEALANGQRERVALVGGWGTREDIRIELSPVGSRGHLAVRVLLTEVRSFDVAARLEAHFVTEPAPLQRFADELRNALHAGLVTTLPLYVEGGPTI
jgi:hypothetical protein